MSGAHRAGVGVADVPLGVEHGHLLVSPAHDEAARVRVAIHRVHPLAAIHRRRLHQHGRPGGERVAATAELGRVTAGRVTASLRGAGAIGVIDFIPAQGGGGDLLGALEVDRVHEGEAAPAAEDDGLAVLAELGRPDEGGADLGGVGDPLQHGAARPLQAGAGHVVERERHVVPSHGHHRRRRREADAPDGLGVLELVQRLRAVSRVVDVGAPRAGDLAADGEARRVAREVHLVRVAVGVRVKGRIRVGVRVGVRVRVRVAREAHRAHDARGARREGVELRALVHGVQHDLAWLGLGLRLGLGLGSGWSWRRVGV